MYRWIPPWTGQQSEVRSIFLYHRRDQLEAWLIYKSLESWKTAFSASCCKECFPSTLKPVKNALDCRTTSPRRRNLPSGCWTTCSLWCSKVVFVNPRQLNGGTARGKPFFRKPISMYESYFTLRGGMSDNDFIHAMFILNVQLVRKYDDYKDTVEKPRDVTVVSGIFSELVCVPLL